MAAFHSLIEKRNMQRNSLGCETKINNLHNFFGLLFSHTYQNVHPSLWVTLMPVLMQTFPRCTIPAIFHIDYALRLDPFGLMI